MSASSTGGANKIAGMRTAPAQTVVVTDTGVTAVPLAVAAASATDIFTVTSDTGGDTVVARNGTTIDDVPTDSLLSLSITGGPAYVGIDFTAGDPIPVGGFFSDAAQINFSGPHGTDPLVTAGTTADLGSDQITFSPSTVLVNDLDTAGGLVTVRGTAIVELPFNGSTPQPVTVLPGASVVVTGSTTISTLTVDPGGTFRMAESGASLLVVGSLNLEGPDAAGDNGAVLDLSDNQMIARQTPDSIIDGLLANGFDGGLWDATDDGGGNPDWTATNGPFPAAIVSSAAASDVASLHALGHEQVGANPDEWNSSDSFDGVNVADGDVLIKYTLYGDTNLDGIVDTFDESLVANGLALGLTGWSDGSFAYSGATSVFDETLLDGVGFLPLLEGVTSAPTTSPTTAPTFGGPNGSVTGGRYVEGSTAQISGNGVEGEVEATTGAQVTVGTGNNAKTFDDAIALTFRRADGITAAGNSHWIRLITKTETDANGTPVNGTYVPQPIIQMDATGKTTGPPIAIKRTLGQTYCDTGSTLGWDSNIRPESGVEIGVDQPDDRSRILKAGQNASTTWIGHDYLVANDAVLYEFSWEFRQFIVPGYDGVFSGYSSEVDGDRNGDVASFLPAASRHPFWSDSRATRSTGTGT